ncbi:hypothetical protein Bca4012_051407 [Brassica carinata]
MRVHNIRSEPWSDDEGAGRYNWMSSQGSDDRGTIVSVVGQRDCPTRRQNPLHQKCQGVPPGHTYLKRKYLWLHCQILEEQRRQNC